MGNFEINLQLFGGGGSRSGLGGGGEVDTYEFGLYDARNKKWTRWRFTGKTEEEARKKANRFAKREGYKQVSDKSRKLEE